MKPTIQYPNIKRTITFLIVVLVIVITGCKKFLVIPPPITLTTTATVFSNNATATAAQVNIYTTMWTGQTSWLMSQYMGEYADELQSYSTPGSAPSQLYTNALQAITVGSSYGPWSNTGAFKYIYSANAVIEGLQNSPGCSAAVKKQLSGEAYFIRAFWHFYLTNIYGDAPLVLSTNYAINNTASRTPRVEVLKQVVNDLQTAQSLLNPNYVDLSDTLTTALRIRPNKAAATALLARAYLYLGDYNNQNAQDYQKADSAATAVISSGSYALMPLNSVFSTTSKEAIWQLQTPTPATWNTYDGDFFILSAAPAAGINNSTTISPQLLSAIESGDQRVNNWIGTYTTTVSVSYKFPYKYKGNQANYSSTNITEYNTVLRLAEIYLIRAEARVHEGNIPGAVADLNMIRNRAGLANYNGATDAASLMSAILHERQVELFCEWGHRWFDLCRTGKAPSVMGAPGNVCQAKGGIWASDNHQLLFPIPQADLNNDVNLKQNPGY